MPQAKVNICKKKSQVDTFDANRSISNENFSIGILNFHDVFLMYTTFA